MRSSTSQRSDHAAGCWYAAQLIRPVGLAKATESCEPASMTGPAALPALDGPAPDACAGDVVALAVTVIVVDGPGSAPPPHPATTGRRAQHRRAAARLMARSCHTAFASSRRTPVRALVAGRSIGAR